MKLRLSSDFVIDTDDYKREGLRVSILAMSGHGKSNAAADLVEDVLDSGGQVIVVEPIPEWHTLKARYNNVVVVGGPYQDLPLEPGFAHEYVKAALEKGISLVVNVSDIEDDVDQLKFVSNFLWNLYRLEQKYRRVLFLVLEEADTWAPQMWDQASKPCLSRVSLIAKHGRKIGIFPVLVSQRPADLHKSPLSQCNVNLFGKFTSPADLDSKTGVMFVAKKLHLPIEESQIMSLETGSFLVSDKTGVHTVAVRKRLCPHGADTPLIDAKPFTADLNQALGGLREEISRAVDAKKQEQNEVKRLEKMVQDLKKEAVELREKANIKLSMKEMLTNGADSQQSVGVMTPKLSEDVQKRLKFLAEQNIEKDKKIGFLELKEKSYKEQLAGAEKALKVFDELRCWLRMTIDVQNIYDNIHKVDDRVSDVEKVVKGLPTALPMDGEKIVLSETVPEFQHKISRPVVETDDSTLEGRLISLAFKGFFNEKRRLTGIAKEVDRVYATSTVNHASRDLNPVLDVLVRRKVLQREESGGSWEYWLFDGAKERIKEAS